MTRVKGITLAAVVCTLVGLAGFGAWADNACPKYVDANGDGVCDNQGSGSCGQGENYVDADGDGVCDNKGSGECGKGQGKGKGQCGKGNGGCQREQQRAGQQ